MNLDKYFRCYEIIDLDNIRFNIEQLNSKRKEGTGTVCVIKTDGYGHGAVPIAKVTDDLCDAYALATAAEALNLRRHNITKPLFILGYESEYYYDEIISNDIIPCVFTYETAKDLSKHAVALGKQCKINIAVDTGMSRIGFLPNEDSVETIKRIANLDNIIIESIFTHFAKADYKDKTSAYKQLDVFSNFVHELNDEGILIPIVQCANSAAMMEMPETSMSLDRAGISMYGLYPSEEMDMDNIVLKPAMSLMSHVVHVKEVEQGVGVSYGHTYVTSQKTKIATIPIGYGDGYSRNLSNKGYVIIRGVKVPIIGRVCMDQMMVDVTGLDVNVGDQVTLVGFDGDEHISVEELSELAGTFNYEFVCNISKRVPRVYKYNGEIVASKDYIEDDYQFDIN